MWNKGPTPSKHSFQDIRLHTFVVQVGSRTFIYIEGQRSCQIVHSKGARSVKLGHH